MANGDSRHRGAVRSSGVTYPANRSCLAINEWVPHRPRLNESHEGVVDRTVTVRVVVTENVADDTRALKYPRSGR